jgi:hypothetical protein
MDHVAEATQHVINAQYDLDAAVSKKDWLENHLDGMIKLTDAYNMGELSLDQYNQKIHELDAAMTVTETGQIAWNGAVQTADSLMQGWKVSLEAIDDEINTANGVLSAANQELELTNSQAERYQQQLDTLTEAERQATEANNAMNESLRYSIEAEGEAQLAWDQLSEAEQNAVLRATEAMTTLQTNVESALSSQMNMFEEFKSGSAMSTDQLLANMQSQGEGVKNWESNLKELAERGIDQDLLQKLAAMGPEGSGYVETFKNMTADQLKEANSLWKEGLDIQGFGNDEAIELQNAVGAIAAGGKLAFADLGNKLGIDAGESGKNVGQGLINGLNNLKGEIEAAGEEMGTDTIEAINTALGVHSPSTKTFSSGKDTDQGLANGITQGKGPIITAINGINQLVEQNLLTKLKEKKTALQTIGMELTTSLATGISHGRSNVSSSINGVNTTVQDAQAHLRAQEAQWRAIGTALCAGLAAGIIAGQSQVVNAVTKVTTDAVNRAKAAMQVANSGTTTVVRAAAAGSIRAASNPANVRNDFGGTVINVYGTAGQDEEALAGMVMDRIETQYERISRAWGR